MIFIKYLRLVAGLMVAGLAFGGMTAARADTLDTQQTLVKAYNVETEGCEHLQEGYVDRASWEETRNGLADDIQSLLDELSELSEYLTDEQKAFVESFDLNSLTFIQEMEESEVTLTTTRDEALAAKERKLEQQRQEEAAKAQQARQTASVQYSSGSSGYMSNGSGLTASSGVNYYNGRRETYYSSNVLYHYRTNEWTVDSEGFYRTPDGHYVVAASDLPQGTVFQGSKGTCEVLDSGCAGGTTDYYVAW